MKLIFTGPACAVQNPTGFSRHRSALLKIAMRIGFFYIGLIITSVQLIANPGNGQGLDDIKVTLEMNNETLETLFLKIQRETDLSFAFRPDLIDPYTNITLSKATRSVKQVLDQVLTSTSLTYKQMDKTVLVYAQAKEETNVEEQQAVGEAPPVVSDVPVMVLYTVSGKVTDVSGAPMAGVNIIIKGTARGTQTDEKGTYAIDVLSTDILVFSFIGFANQEVAVGNQANIDVIMQESISNLEEVVINAGYWEIRKEEQTGNISRVTGDEIQKQPVTNPLQALQGRMPGVLIEQYDGLPGSKIKIQIRGQNSLRPDGNDPLYVIDGIPYPSVSLHTSNVNSPFQNGTSSLNSLNPNDIESIEILKDADATAIYGSRGANGVVLITTKKGKAGTPKVDINYQQGFGKVTRMIELLNTEEYLEMRKEAFANDGLTPQVWDYDLNGKWDQNRYTDWQKIFIGGTAHTSNAQVSISGGEESTQFFVGGGYYRQTSVFPDDGKHWKASGHFNVSHSTPDEKLSISMTGNFVSENNDMSASDLTSLANRLVPNAPEIFDENGNLNWEENTWENPFAEVYRRYESSTENLLTNLNFSYKFSKYIKAKTNLGYNSIHFKEVSTRPIFTIPPSWGVDRTDTGFGNGTSKTWIIEPQIDYRQSLGKVNLNFIVGSTFQQNNVDNEFLFVSGISTDALLRNRQAGTSFFPSSEVSQYRYAAVFGRANFSWDTKYIINLTGRRDGSSRFGPNNRFANFGAVGAAWIFSNEEFVQEGLSFLSFGKLRLSYGTSGSDQIGNYQYLDTYSSTQYSYQNGSGLLPTRLANPNYSWETNKKMEIALELGLFDSRISFDISWYRNRSSSQLVGYSLPQITGFSSIQYNLPATVQNLGWEFQLSSNNIKSKEVSWTSNLNFSIPRSKLIDYPNIEASAYNNTYKVGESLNLKKTYEYQGVNPETGLYTFNDFSGDGTLSFTNDGRFLEEVGVRYYGGLQNLLQFKGIQLDFLFQFVKQTGRNYLYSGFMVPGVFNASVAIGNQPRLIMDRWQKEGDVSEIQRFSTGEGPGVSPYFRAISSNKAVEDASFIRLKNVSLSYSLPQKLSDRLRFKSTRVYFQGQNLLTLTNYNGADPETQNALILPPLRIFSFGVQITL